MLHVGSVPHCNAKPLLEGLEAEPNVRLSLAPPSTLASRLLAGDLDVALVPSVETFRHPGLVLVPAGCVASSGAVTSVGLFAREPLAPGARVLLDRSSRTSQALARLLLAGPLRVPGARFEDCDPATTDPRTADADAVLLIGDRALLLPREGLLETDLGEAWTAWTGLPFVWAVWAARDEACAREAGPVLRRARDRGRANLSAVVWREAGRLGVEERVIGRYLTRHVRHDLGPEERRGLERFREECARGGLLRSASPAPARN